MQSDYQDIPKTQGPISIGKAKRVPLRQRMQEYTSNPDSYELHQGQQESP